MSVQLIVYPQNYDGQYSVISGNPTNALVNGISFTGLNSTPSYDSSANNPSQDTIINAQPTIPNSWYRFRSTTPTAPDLPEVSNGKIVFYIPPAAIGSVSGVYQRLGNLVIGQQYEVNLTMGGGSEGFIVFQVYDGTTYVSSSIAAVGTPIITHTFTPTAPDNIVMVYYYTTVSDVVEIEEISIFAVSTLTNTTLSNGQVLCDLYEDEDIPLSLSVDDFKNVAEKVQSYSKAFNLPATKRNNRIFDNIFEITRSNDGVIFNPYKKTKCVLKQDGFILFEGYLRMLDVTDKKGETSYNVNLYSEVVALADFLGDRTFRDLDFTELEHDYDRTEIVNSWNDSGIGITYDNPNTSGFRDDFSTVKYPFVDWTHQIEVGALTTPVLPNLETAFRPFINIKYLIDRIFNQPDFPFTYESAFFDTVDFKKLFMDFNWGGDGFAVADNVYDSAWERVGSLLSNVGTGSFKALRLVPESVEPLLVGSTVPPNYQGDPSLPNPYIITATTTNEMYNISYNFKVFNNNLFPKDCECRWIHKIGGVAQPPINNVTLSFIIGGQYAGSFDIILNTGDTLEAQFKGDSDIEQDKRAGKVSSAIFTQSSNLVNSAGLLTLRGELSQWDFLKGLITMFNLVTLVDEDNPNNIKIEPYSDVFIPTATTLNPLTGNTLADRGIEHDWTNKIDVSEMKLTPLTDLNKKTTFKFVEDDDDYSFNQYKNLVGGHLYGSKKYNAGEEFNILFGEDEIVAEPFAATLVKPLMSQFPDFITPAIYSMNEDGTSEGFENSPRIMYNNGVVDITSTTYSVPAQNGVAGNAVEDEFLQFSHLSDVPTIQSTSSITGSRDFHFGECQLMQGVGDSVPDNLFNLYWLPYYAELYNPNTRIMTIKVNLSPADINTFKFNDTVYIKNRVFRVNKIDYKPNDLAKVEFILIP